MLIISASFQAYVQLTMQASGSSGVRPEKIPRLLFSRGEFSPDEEKTLNRLTRDSWYRWLQNKNPSEKYRCLWEKKHSSGENI